MDPHFQNLASNINIAMHVFDRLIEQDERQNLRPGLASEWKALNDTTWEFKIREGVKWSDGEPLTAAGELVAARRGRLALGFGQADDRVCLHLRGVQDAGAGNGMREDDRVLRPGRAVVDVRERRHDL